MKTFGLGDLAYYAFRPVVYGIDAVWQTDLRHCDVCKERRRHWNSIVSVPMWLAVAFLMTLAALTVWWVK